MVKSLLESLGSFHFYIIYIPLVILILKDKVRKSLYLYLVIALTLSSGIALTLYHSIFDLEVILHSILGTLALLVLLDSHNQKKKYFILLFAIISGVYSHYGKTYFYKSLKSDQEFKNIVQNEQWYIFSEKIFPLMQSKCLRCHSKDKQLGDIDLESISALFTQNPSIPIIKPFDSSKSLLYQVITKDMHHKDHMPKYKGMLNPRDIQLIKSWIDKGALSFSSKVTLLTKKKNKYNNHWSLNTSFPHNIQGLDQLYFAILEKNNITYSIKPLSSEALEKKRTLAITGLLPKYFILRDTDSLLSSKEYAQKRLSYWLDYISYKEDVENNTHGKISYKKFILDSYYKDSSYMDFFKNQFKVHKTHYDNLSNTSFYRHQSVGENPEGTVERLDNMVKNIFHLSSGIDISCAKCHDHKYLPISNEDYMSQLLVFGDMFFKDNPLSHIKNHKSRLNKDHGLIKKNIDIYQVSNNERQEISQYLTDIKNGLGFFTARQYVDLIFKSITGKSFISNNKNHHGAIVNIELIPLINYITHKFINNNFSTKFLIKLIVSSKLFTHDISTKGSFSLQKKRWLSFEEFRNNILFLSKRLADSDQFITKNINLSHIISLKKGIKYPSSFLYPRNEDTDLFKEGFNQPIGDRATFDRNQRANYISSLALLDKEYFRSVFKLLDNQYNISKGRVQKINNAYNDFFNRNPTRKEKMIWEKFFKKEAMSKNKQAEIFYHVLITSDEFLRY